MPVDRLLELTYLAEQSHFWFRGFRTYVKPAIVRVTAGVARPQILDCGCGTGSNLEILGEHGDAVGFDITRTGVEFARAHGQRVAEASIRDIPFQAASFDVVTCFDVLQALPEDVERVAMAEMWRVLRPGGWLLMHVAALGILHGRHAVLSQDLRRYSPSNLRAVIERGGFEIDRLTFHHASLLPIMLPVRAWHRISAREGAVPAGEGEITVPWAPINAALSALVSLESLASRFVDMPIGSSLMCLARKAPGAP